VLRFHLMIGAAASGKSTAARILARCLQGPDQPPVRYVSSAEIRQELYGEAAILGRWQEVEAVIQQRLEEAIADGDAVILEASYVKRSFRLAITQALQLSAPVQWIGWWLDTPLSQCLAWNRQRERQVPEAVIRRHCAQLLQSAPVPQRQEGFAQVVRLQCAQDLPLEQLIPSELERLEACVQRGANRDAAHHLHGYSRLLDLERLLYLIRLLSAHPVMTGTESGWDPELEQLLPPLPAAGLADQAAALLGRLHGACYADAVAVQADLDWLDRNGFTGRWQAAAAALPEVLPPPWPIALGRPQGGLPRLADRPAFQQVFTLLRHLLHHPYDRGAGERISEHLSRSLTAGGTGRVWTPRQVQAALAETLTPYGFRLPGRRSRGGYGLGTAVLSGPELLSTCQLLQLQAIDLGDPQAAAISEQLAGRLAGMGLDPAESAPLRRWLQPFPPPLSGQQDVIDTAIRQRRRLLLSAAGQGEQRGRSQTVWPLQLMLHNSRWWLLVEHDAIGQPIGLLAALELEHIHVFQSEQQQGRDAQQHQQALARAELLRQRCGGLCFGGSVAAQLACCSANAADGPATELLRFHCAAAVMARVRQELQRYPRQAVRLAPPLPGHSWGRPLRASAGGGNGSEGRRCGGGDRRSLVASADPLHPYPVEVDLPPWVLADDPELRRWLFSYGGAVRIEAPAALVREHREWLMAALAVHGSGDGEALADSPNREEGAPPTQQSNNHSRSHRPLTLPVFKPSNRPRR